MSVLGASRANARHCVSLLPQEPAGALEIDVRLRVQGVAVEDDKLRVDAAVSQRLNVRPRDPCRVDRAMGDAHGATRTALALRRGDVAEPEAQVAAAARATSRSRSRPASSRGRRARRDRRAGRRASRPTRVRRGGSSSGGSPAAEATSSAASTACLIASSSSGAAQAASSGARRESQSSITGPIPPDRNIEARFGPAGSVCALPRARRPRPRRARA